MWVDKLMMFLVSVDTVCVDKDKELIPRSGDAPPTQQ